MQRFLGKPVWAPLFAVFGIVMIQLGYGYVHRGSFQYTPANAPTRTISPATSPAMYWGTSLGMLLSGLLLLALSAYALLCLVRTYRAGELAVLRRPNPLGLIMIILASILIILAIIFR